MVLDFRNLTRGDQIAGVAGVALFVIMVAFKWFGAKGEVLGDSGLETVEGITQNAFQSFTVIDLVLLLTALAAIALPLWTASGRSAIGPIRPGAIVAALGVLALVLIAFRLISPPDLSTAVPDTHVSDFPGTEVTRKVGAWLGLGAAALIAYGGYLSARDSREPGRVDVTPGPRGPTS